MIANLANIAIIPNPQDKKRLLRLNSQASCLSKWWIFLMGTPRQPGYHSSLKIIIFAFISWYRWLNF